MGHDSRPGDRTSHDALSIAELLDQAEQQRSVGHLARAVALAREAVARTDSDPVESSVESHVATLVRVSQLFGDAGEDAAAILTCQRALELIPMHAHATYNAARALKHLGRHAQAESLLDDVLACHPHDLDLLILKADLLILRGATGEAVALLQQVVQRVSENTVAWFNMSNALLHLHDYAEALQAAERVIALASSPQVTDAWVNKGRALTGLGEDLSAIAAFQEALRINRAQLQAHNGLALIYQRHGQRLRAWRERLYGRLLFMLYTARHHAVLQLQRDQRDQLRSFGVDSNTARAPGSS